ncbi:MAG: hypothetical protein AMXMBFR64_28600 [Myxococcales bacterium]
MKPAEIIDRDAEWRTLETMWRKDRPQLVFVLGRRRVGKSFVLARFARAVGGLYYQATRRTEPEQLAHLSRIVGDRFDDGVLKQGVPFPSWEALLGYLTERARSEPLLVVLDELPYLVGATPALPSILQSAWDHDWAGSRLKVVLSGSFVSAMRALEGADQPLYGRRTARLALGPFAFQEATGFMPSYAPLDQLTAYGLFGNLPGHLALIDPAPSVAENASAVPLSRLRPDRRPPHRLPDAPPAPLDSSPRTSPSTDPSPQTLTACTDLRGSQCSFTTWPRSAGTCQRL